jgi:hypothetical protein
MSYKTLKNASKRIFDVKFNNSSCDGKRNPSRKANDLYLQRERQRKIMHTTQPQLWSADYVN